LQNREEVGIVCLKYQTMKVVPNTDYKNLAFRLTNGNCDEDRKIVACMITQHNEIDDTITLTIAFDQIPPPFRNSFIPNSAVKLQASGNGSMATIVLSPKGAGGLVVFFGVAAFLQIAFLYTLNLNSLPTLFLTFLPLEVSLLMLVAYKVSFHHYEKIISNYIRCVGQCNSGGNQ
jgi:hypothetical protein